MTCKNIKYENLCGTQTYCKTKQTFRVPLTIDDDLVYGVCTTEVRK